jgi:hypothetical protein
MRSFVRPLGVRLQRSSSLLLVAFALLLALPAAAPAATFTARLTAPNHQPTANKRWPIIVTARRGGTPLSGSVRYQFLFQSQVVASRPGHRFSNGVFHDTLLFPGGAIGKNLSLHVIVSTKYGTVVLPWWIKTRA